jgi:hypothetical protein
MYLVHFTSITRRPRHTDENPATGAVPACFQTALRFAENIGRHGICISENEIQAAASSGHLSPRILRQAAWAEQQFQGRYAGWLPVAAAANGGGKTGHKRPDLVLIKQNLAPVAVEVELTLKAKIADYVRVLEAYDKAIVKKDFLSVIYVTAEVCGNSGVDGAISKALSTALARGARSPVCRCCASGTPMK